MQIVLKLKTHWTDNKVHVTKDNTDYDEKKYYGKNNIRQDSKCNKMAPSVASQTCNHSFRITLTLILLTHRLMIICVNRTIISIL